MSKTDSPSHTEVPVERQNQVRLLFQNIGEKFQENDTQMLLDSQENIFRNVSAVLSQSSHSTNVGDLEETLLRATDTEKETEVEESNVPSRYDLRIRPVLKRPKNQFQTKTVSKSPKPSKTGKPQETTPFSLTTGEFHPLQHDDLEESQKSVSMLQECYQENPKNYFPDLMETCMNSVLEVIDIYSDEETEVPVMNELTMVKVESSTQTEFLPFESKLNQTKEKEMAKHAKFISSVVKLKAALASKNTISDKKLWAILQGADDEESMEIDEQTLPKETIGYILRSSDVENVFRETVQVLLHHLDDTLKEDFMKVACCWRNSVYETVVEMLSQAVDSEAGVWKMVASFLCRIIDSILKGKSKNWTSESKTNFVTTFCQSTRLSYSVINYIIKNLKKLKTIHRPNDTADKLFSVYLTNNSCFLLQILECSLDFLKTKVSGEAIEGVLVKKLEGKNYNVLEMWKKHWNREEVSEEQKAGHEWETTVSGWCDVLDDILLHCVLHVPVLSAAVERCGELAKDIFKLSHSGKVG